MAARVIIPATAFSTDGSRRTRRSRVKSKSHLDFIRSLPCIISGKYGEVVDAAHIRYADVRYGKRATGMQEKPDDMYVVPLLRAFHVAQHSENERAWWCKFNIDPVPIAQALYIHSGNVEICEMILAAARKP